MDQSGFLQRCRDACIATDFSSFIRQSFQMLNPALSFLPNWHIDLLAEYLEACRKGEISRLLINMPPRALKSVCVSVAWPAWVLAQQPDKRIMTASYAQSLSEKHAVDCRILMQSMWYRRLFPHTQLSRVQNEKHKFLTTQQGMVMATSVLGAATGEGGDILIADDIMNPRQALSCNGRATANGWFEHTYASRLNDKKRGCIVVVMQRLHRDDLSGILLQKGGWEHVCLPAIETCSRQWTVGEKTWQREAGELLHPAREDAAMLARARQELGSLHFAAQYQQQPLPLDGGMVRLEWFSRFDALLSDG